MPILKRYMTKDKECRLNIDISLDSICMIQAIIEEEIENGLPSVLPSIDSEVIKSCKNIIQEITEDHSEDD